LTVNEQPNEKRDLNAVTRSPPRLFPPLIFPPSFPSFVSLLRFPPSFPDTDDGGSMGTRAFHLLESLPRSSIPPRQIGESQICARGLRKLKACRGRIFAIRHSSEPPCFSLPTSRPGKVIGLSADKRRFHRIKTSHDRPHRLHRLHRLSQVTTWCGE
jgi:hypothetical protein